MDTEYTACVIDPKEIELLPKVWALRSSPHAGEAMAACDRAAAIVAKYGKTIANVPDLFGRTPLHRWDDALAWASSRLTAQRGSTSEADAQPIIGAKEAA